MHFQLRIDLGNEAMQTAQDLGAALIDLGERFHALGDQPLYPHNLGGVKDANGNTVGAWEVSR